MHIHYAKGRSPSLRRALGTIAAAVSLSLAGTAAADVITATDTSWKVTTAAPSSGWNTSLGFNDSGWQNATDLGIDVGASMNDPSYVAKAIWSSDGQFSRTETQIWVRHAFTVATPLLSALLTVGCDDDCQVWVNGTQVVNDQNGSAGNSTADVLPYLTSGTNLITAVVSDNWPVWGWNHVFWGQINGQPLGVSAVPEPSTYALLGIGLSLIGFAGLRRRKS